MGDTERQAFACTFARGGWRPEDWLLVRRADWDHYGQWVQADTYIENATPAVDPEKLDWHPGDNSDEYMTLVKQTHTGMVYRQPLSGDWHVSATMAFTSRMAPSIVFGTLVESARPTHRQYRESWEVVLWDEGINVWQQTVRDSGVQWIRIGYAAFTLLPHTSYTLSVRRAGPHLHIQVGDHRFGLHDATLPACCYAGITGCEGINRFYDFRLAMTE